MASSTTNLRLPDPLRVTGSSVADNWKRFREQWENYELAADLTDASSEKRAAVLLTCVGNDAYDIYRTLDFETPADKKKIDKVIEAFEAFCVGAVNVTYERYVFNKRQQESGERFDVFLGEVRRMARTCRFDGVEESMIRDRIVVGIRDDATRRKLLQVRDLTLIKAIDICKASEAAGRQLKAMASADEIQAINSSKRSTGRTKDRENSRGRGDSSRGRDKSTTRRCKYCDRQHEMTKEACPAFGKICRRCSKKHHFESVCKSKVMGAKLNFRKQHVCDIETDDEELLTLSDTDGERWYSKLKIGKMTVKFLLDCGATVNLLPETIVREIGRMAEIKPAVATLRMFDRSELATRGMITIKVQHPKSKCEYVLDFYVAAKHQQPILGFNACRAMNLLKVVEENICEVQGYRNDSKPAGPPSGGIKAENKLGCLTEAVILSEYADLFDGVGLLEGEVHLEVDKSVRPVQMPLRRLPIGVREKVAVELKRLTDLGILVPVSEPTEWVSALLVVARPNGRIRICVDTKPSLNRALIRATHYMPTIDDILPQLARVRVMSTVDTADGFWHLKLDDESSRLTTMETPWGRHRWTRMCFGLSVAPEIFQARLQAALSGLKGIAIIADDILIYGSGDNDAEAMIDHNNNLRALLQRCREKNIKLNKKKLRLNRDSTVFCGMELTREGVKPDRRKIDAIMRMPAPTDRKGVQRLIGFATYLSRFCPRFSDVMTPIRELLNKQNEFVWRPETHGVAFEKLKDILTREPVLAYFDPSKPITVQADSSSFAIGAVLLCDGRPVEYASRRLTKLERNWAQIELECMATLFALERFHTYVYARHVTCETDHRPLLSITKKALSTAPTRLQRMLLRLQRYSYELVYTPGSKLILPDTLSRACPLNDSDTSANEFPEELIALIDEQQMDMLRMVASQKTINMIRAAADDDPVYIKLKEQIAAGWPTKPDDVAPELRPYVTFADELIESGGFVFKGYRVVIPHGARDDILARIHTSHGGVNACIRRAREAVYFPGITKAIKEMVARCSTYARFQTETRKEPLMSNPAPSRPWQRVAADIFTFRGQDYLVCTCALSAYYEVDRLESKKVKDIIYVLRQQWARHGVPEELCTDNSPFLSAEFREHADTWGFKHTTSSPTYSQANGCAEAAVRRAKTLMAKAAEAGVDPFLALLDQRNTPSEYLHLSPAQMMFGRRTRTLLPTTDALLATPTAAGAQVALTKSKERQAAYYNRGAMERPTLPVGQTVRFRHNEGDWRKAEVDKILPFRSYQLRLADGSTRRRNARHVTFSSEPKIIPIDDDYEQDAGAPARRSPATPTVPRVNIKQTRQPPPPTGVMAKSDTVDHKMTRSGRAIIKPARYRQ